MYETVRHVASGVKEKQANINMGKQIKEITKAMQDERKGQERQEGKNTKREYVEANNAEKEPNTAK
jgi:hypothetical protein